MTAPSRHDARAVRKRQVRVARHEAARDVFANLGHGCETVVLTHGQFSLVDALAALLDRTGPASLSFSTWSAAHADLEHARRFLDDGRVLSIRMLVDRSFQTRHPDYCATLRRLYGDQAVRTTRLHAKWATIRNDGWNLAVRTSMNLNENPRLELIEVSDDEVLADFLDGEMDQFFDEPAGDFSGEMMAPAPAPKISMGHTVRVGAD